MEINDVGVMQVTATIRNPADPSRSRKMRPSAVTASDARALMSSIRAGEDTELELKEVVFRGKPDFVCLGRRTSRAKARRTLRQYGQHQGRDDCDGGP